MGSTVVRELVTRYKLEVSGEGKTQRALAATSVAADKAARSAKRLTPLGRGWDTQGPLGRISRSVDESAQEMYDRGWSAQAVRRRASRIDALDAARAGGWVPRRDRGSGAGGGVADPAPSRGAGRTGGRGGVASRIGSAFTLGSGVSGGGMIGGALAMGPVVAAGVVLAAMMGKLAEGMKTTAGYLSETFSGNLVRAGERIDNFLYGPSGQDREGQKAARLRVEEAKGREALRRSEMASGFALELNQEKAAWEAEKARRGNPGRQQLDRDKELFALDMERKGLNDPAGAEVRAKRAELEAYKLSQKPKTFTPQAQRQGELDRMIFGGGDLGAMGITPTELGGIKHPKGQGRRVAVTGMRGVSEAFDRLEKAIAKEMQDQVHEVMRDVARSGARS